MSNWRTPKAEQLCTSQPAGLMSTQVREGCCPFLLLLLLGAKRFGSRQCLSPLNHSWVVVKLLASYGSVNQRDCNGNTPLHLG